MKRRVALVHDWLTGMRGGEKVLDGLCEIFPDADVFTLFHAKGSVSPRIESHRIVTSALQKIPGALHAYRRFLPLMPWAIDQFDFSAYDLIVSTSHCVAKAARPHAGATHWCYCHTPMRYIWDQFDQYFGPGRTDPLTRLAMNALRGPLQRWDRKTLDRVNHFVANSRNVQERIQRLYGRPSEVIYPPVDVAFYAAPAGPRPEPKPYLLMVTALAPYKNVDLAVAACRETNRSLIVIGSGPERQRLEAIAGPTVRFLGWKSDATIRDYYAHCDALLFPGEEDFGIVPLEAMAAGRPVIALRRGGATETVVDKVTGLFFEEPTVSALRGALDQFSLASFSRSALQAHAETFSRDRFRQIRQSFVEVVGEMS